MEHIVYQLEKKGKQLVKNTVLSGLRIATVHELVDCAYDCAITTSGRLLFFNATKQFTPVWAQDIVVKDINVYGQSILILTSTGELIGYKTVLDDTDWKKTDWRRKDNHEIIKTAVRSIIYNDGKVSGDIIKLVKGSDFGIITTDTCYIWGQSSVKYYLKTQAAYTYKEKGLLPHPKDDRYTDIRTDRNFYLMLTASGKVFMKGKKKKEKDTVNEILRKPYESPIYEAVEIEFPNSEFISSIGTSNYQFLAVTKQGKVYTYGQDYASIAVGEDLLDAKEPLFMDTFDVPIGQVFLSSRRTYDSFPKDHHCYAINKSGRGVYAWGSNYNQECCQQSDEPFYIDPVPILSTFNDRITYIAIGKTRTYFVAENPIGHLESLINAEEYSDITLNVEGGKPLFAHKAILLARCKSILEFEAKDGTCDLTKVGLKLPRSTWLSFLRYLYTDAIRLTEENTIGVQTLANHFKSSKSCSALLDKCSQYLKKKTKKAKKETKEFVSTFSSDFSSIFNDKKSFTDCEVQVADQQFYCHKILLISSCKYFEALFTAEMEESRTNCIKIDNFPATIIESTLKYIYGIDDNMESAKPEELVELLNSSNFFNLDAMKCKLEKLLQKQITKDNILELYSISDVHQAPLLMQSCFSFIKTNWEQNKIIHSDNWKNLDESLKADLLQKLPKKK